MSDDEDYMSTAFLAQVEDVKPGISAGRAGRRLLRINAHRDEAAEKQSKSKDELEKHRLIEGLNEPIRAESKGFKLLVKMGYKEGMSLGRAAEGGQQSDNRRKEPISVQVRTDRSGVGMDEHRKGKQTEWRKRRANIEEDLACDFQRRKRTAVERKQLLSDIQKLIKTCHEMDTRLDKTLPDEFWFWPIYSSKRELVEESNGNLQSENGLVVGVKSTDREGSTDGEDQAELYKYGNGKEAPTAINFNEFDNQTLGESVIKISAYMRQMHFYCLYCGCAFSSSEEMDSECPGTTREDHE